MRYDFSRIDDAAHINNIVTSIRANRREGTLPQRSLSAIRGLIRFLSLESCEDFLKQVFDLPYIQYNGCNGLTTFQMAQIFRVSGEYVRFLTRNKMNADTVRLAGGTLAELFSNSGVQFSSRCGSACFNNPRAILYVAISRSIVNDDCLQVLRNIYDSICNDSDWILNLPLSIEPAAEAEPEVPDPVEKTAIVAVLGQKADKAVPKTKSAERRKPRFETAEYNLLGFLNMLRPGTEIKITIPA